MGKQIWLIKFGGSLLSDDKTRRAFLRQAAALSRRQKIVLVHGGGPEITAALSKAGIKPKWVKGRRVTDAASMVVVEGVLSGQVNKKLAGELNALGIKAVGLSGRDGGLLIAKPVPGLGRVGAPSKASPSVLAALLKAGFLPVVSSVASDKQGRALNVNADEAAAALAASLKAARLIYLTDVPGVLDGNKKTIPVIRARGLKKLIKDGIITGGMIPKTLSCAASLRQGVGEVDIIDGRAGLSRMKGTRILP